MALDLLLFAAVKTLSIALLAVAVSGCLADAGDDDAPSAVGGALSTTSAQQILDLVNYPGTDVHALDVNAGLDTRAAANIIAARNGADGLAPSADDVAFATIAQLDAIPQVGDAAFTKLAAYAVAHPAPAGEIVKQVAFRGWESESIVWGVNHATIVELDGMLEARAASLLVAKRPFSSVAQMGTVEYVGSAALGKLLLGAPAWWTGMHGGTLGGTFDGVAFDGATATIALHIANEATAAQLTGHGVTSAPASTIIAGRPFTTLAQVSNLNGVGTATMTALHTYATSGAWGTPGSTIASFTAAMSPHLAGLYFLSESDRPLDIVSFAGAGDLAPTAASVMAVTHAEAGSTAVQRGIENYYVALETDDASIAAIRAVVEAQLTDVVYIAVSKPASDIDHALVDVYLVGRTASGDLVGLHSIAVET